MNRIHFMYVGMCLSLAMGLIGFGCDSSAPAPTSAVKALLDAGGDGIADDVGQPLDAELATDTLASPGLNDSRIVDSKMGMHRDGGKNKDSARIMDWRFGDDKSGIKPADASGLYQKPDVSGPVEEKDKGVIAVPDQAVVVCGGKAGQPCDDGDPCTWGEIINPSTCICIPPPDQKYYITCDTIKDDECHEYACDGKGGCVQGARKKDWCYALNNITGKMQCFRGYGQASYNACIICDPVQNKLVMSGWAMDDIRYSNWDVYGAPYYQTDPNNPNYQKYRSGCAVFDKEFAITDSNGYFVMPCAHGTMCVGITNDPRIGTECVCHCLEDKHCAQMEMGMTKCLSGSTCRKP